MLACLLAYLLSGANVIDRANIIDEANVIDGEIVIDGANFIHACVHAYMLACVIACWSECYRLSSGSGDKGLITPNCSIIHAVHMVHGCYHATFYAVNCYKVNIFKWL